jgi:hypothetical protein
MKHASVQQASKQDLFIPRQLFSRLSQHHNCELRIDLASHLFLVLYSLSLLPAQVLRKDLSTLQQLVEQVVRHLVSEPNVHSRSSSGGVDGGGSAAWSGLLDRCVAVVAVAAVHTSQHLPRVGSLDAAVAVLEERVVASKQQMTEDVVAMLQRISLQQVRLRLSQKYGNSMEQGKNGEAARHDTGNLSASATVREACV